MDKASRGFYMIMEDLSKQDFVMVQGSLSLDQCQDVLEKMAHFHAVAFCFAQSHPEIVTSWNLKSLYESLENDAEFEEIMSKNFAKFKQDLEQDKSDFLLSKVEKLQGNWRQAYKACVSMKDARFVAHGDLWINNLMFCGSKSVILDWQMLAPDHPMLDVGLLLCTSLSPDDLSTHYPHLIQIYVEQFAKSCKLFHVEEIPFSTEEFIELFLNKVLFDIKDN